MNQERPANGGVTLVELLITLTVLAVLALLAAEVALSTTRSQRQGRVSTRATELGQAILGDVREDLMAAVAFFDRGPTADRYLGMLDLPRDATPLASTALPRVDVDGAFDPDSSFESRTGNALLFARYSWTAECRTRSGRALRIDVARLVHYYLAPSGPDRSGLALAKFVSEPLADGHQIDAVDDPVDRADVLMALAAGAPDADGRFRSPVTVVWRRHGDVDAPATLRETVPETGTLSPEPMPPRPSPWQIRQDAGESTDDLLGDRHVVVATNGMSDASGVARFAQRHDVAGGFPHGLEVQVAGPSYSRRILVHLSLAGAGANADPVFVDMTAVVFVRDL